MSRSPEYNKGNSEQSDIIKILRRGVYPEPQILRRFAPQNDMGEGLLRMTLRRFLTSSSRVGVANLYESDVTLYKTTRNSPYATRCSVVKLKFKKSLRFFLDTEFWIGLRSVSKQIVLLR